MTDLPDIFNSTLPRELTAHQKTHWEQQLASAERARDYALRMLGRISLELPTDTEVLTDE